MKLNTDQIVALKNLRDALKDANMCGLLDVIYSNCSRPGSVNDVTVTVDHLMNEQFTSILNNKKE